MHVTQEFIVNSHGYYHDHSTHFAQIIRESNGYTLIRLWGRFNPSTAGFAVRTPDGFVHELSRRSEAEHLYPAIAKRRR